MLSIASNFKMAHMELKKQSRQRQRFEECPSGNMEKKTGKTFKVFQKLVPIFQLSKKIN